MEKITTNNRIRDQLSWAELTPAEQKELDYGCEDSTFFRYKGSVYDLGEFTRSAPPGWDGVMADSYFSGIVVKWKNDGLIVGLYTC